MSSGSTFPGGTSLTWVDIYDSTSLDGLCGGTPHMHLASTECYLVVAGSGSIQTIDRQGYRVTPLTPGAVVWFTPGTIHRAVNEQDLRVLVLMQNAGLPENGDAVMTFPPDHLRNLEVYRQVAALRAHGPAAERENEVAARRDLAVEGYLRIREAVEAGDFGPLEEFYASATSLVQPAAAGWQAIVNETVVEQATTTLSWIDGILRGAPSHLGRSAIFRPRDEAVEYRFGMCGRLQTHDVSEPLRLS